MIPNQNQWKNGDQVLSCPSSTGKEIWMKLTGPMTFIQMIWNLSLALINIPRQSGNRTLCCKIGGNRARNFKSASRFTRPITARIVLHSVLLPLLILHNHLALTKFGIRLWYPVKWHQWSRIHKKKGYQSRSPSDKVVENVTHFAKN